MPLGSTCRRPATSTSSSTEAMPESNPPEVARDAPATSLVAAGGERPDLVQSGKKRLSLLERTLIAIVRRTFEPGPFSRAMQFGQRTVGCGWIHHCTKHLRHVHGYERLP